MLTFHSFLQRVYHFVKNMAVRVTKQMHRNAAVLSTGFAVLTVVALTSTGFGGGGKSALTAFAETWSETESETDEDVEEIEDLTEAKIQINLTDSRRQGQLVVGELLAREVQQKQESQLAAQAEIENVRKEILREAEAKALAEAEEAAKKAEEEARKASAVVPYTEQDYQVLLRIVQAEAGICDDKGKILVANVILNRVKNGEFPNNITDVVYQKSQFSPVSDGSINTVKISGQTVDCVNRALAGEDYSDGALYFMYRGGSRASAVNWFDGRLTFLFQHERHEFFK
ncbi:MAG: cell wall hydrolase [Hungatella hathewayi]|nr:cell wall hydrolase [Hungatella hathewayi]